MRNNPSNMTTLRALTGVTACSFLASLAAGAQDPRPAVVDYTNHALVRVTVQSARDLLTMQAISDDMWSHGIAPAADGLSTADYRVAPDAMQTLKQSGLKFVILDANLQAGIDAERGRLANQPENPAFFEDYRNLPAIFDQLSDYDIDRPDLVQFIQLAPSLQNQPIQGLRITNESNPTGRCRPAILITGTQHAREWISPMTAMYIIERLVYDYDTNPKIKDLVDRCEIYVVPVVNPDGYVHTWGPDRYWRKNRRPNAGGSFGVDLNRNWGYQWGLTLPHPNAGNATPNSGVYWGTGPFSEPETASLRDYASSLPNLRWQLDVHSYGQLILHPWGYTNQPPPMAADFTKWGTDLAAIIKAVNNKTYTPGTMYTKLYPVSGGNTDWYFTEFNIPSFLIELPGNDFVVPPSLIIPTGKEILEAVLYMFDYTANRYPFLADFTNDCEYSIDDFIAYQTSFALSEDRADLDGDGFLTIDDFITFQTLFAIGG